ncbi:hypothetical protein [Streptomyces sp. DG1A-41]|uniref:hypothetical protein n=1 Tax=Streptomyces sp. DG1A-41 TaxID=3125779 RepID=UPI0030D271F3
MLTATGTWTTCCALPFTETSVVEAATHERGPDDLPDLNGDPDVLHRTAARPSGGGCCSASDWSPSARVRVHDTAAEAD